MTLYSGAMDIYSHQVRIVLAEKGVSVDVLNVDENHPCEDLIDLNPYNSLPTLVDRDLVLYNPHVIMEYLDERFPHPPLLPVYPVARAKSRLMMYRIQRDWYTLLPILSGTDEKAVAAARKELLDSLMTLLPVFGEMPYFLSEEFTLVDCCLGPLLYRLPNYGIEIPASAKALHQYKKRVFSRASFRVSLTEAEREIRETAAA